MSILLSSSKPTRILLSGGRRMGWGKNVGDTILCEGGFTSRSPVVVMIMLVVVIIMKINVNGGCYVNGFGFGGKLTSSYATRLVTRSRFRVSSSLKSVEKNHINTDDSKKAMNMNMKMDRVLSPEYYKSVYENDTIPWDIAGNGQPPQPQPEIVKCFKEGKIYGRIIDAGCGAGENCIYLAQNSNAQMGKKCKEYTDTPKKNDTCIGGITSILGFDLAQGAIDMAENRVAHIEKKLEKTNGNYDWTKPQFLMASCTEIADVYLSSTNVMMENDDKEEVDESLFDVMIDSGLLHCLSDEDAIQYIDQMSKLVKCTTGRAYVGCFSTANPDHSWDNPRRLSEEYLRALFCRDNGWEVLSVRDTWWARPPDRGSSQGAFSMALWMEAKRV